MGLRHRLRTNSFLSIGRRSISNDSDFSPPELVKSGSLYLLTSGKTLLRVWTILRNDNKLVCYNEPDRSLVLASMFLKGHRVLTGRGTTIENNIFFPLYIVEKDQLEECVFVETLASQREWLEAMTSTMDLDQSLSLEGLNLECGKCKEQEKEKMNKEPIPSYFSENAPPLSALRDLQDNNKQIALRRATLLKQRMISTELKVDGLKKLQPEPIYEIPANKLYYQIQLDELNIKLDNYTEAFHKYHELRRQSVSEYLARFTGQKKNDEHDYITMEANESNKYKSAFRMFGSFLDTKLRGHKRTKSADVKRHEYIDSNRPRSISGNADWKLSDSLETSFGQERILRTEISASALREIEEFEKYIKKYLENHPEEYFF